MKEESIVGLNIKPDGIYVDCTTGGAGHSLEIVKKLTTGRLICFDKDTDALTFAKERLKEYDYKALKYSVLVGKESDQYADVAQLMKDYDAKHKNDELWSAFYIAMERHSYDSENESLYEDMKHIFFSRIQKLKKDNNA